MDHSISIAAIAGVIQLAVAPVFLLAGIAGILNVMSIRLGRIVDRARIVERQIPYAQDDSQRHILEQETTSLWERTRLISNAIRASIAASLMVCLVVVALFIGDFVEFNLYGLVGVLFILAMLLLIVGLVLLLLEVTQSTRQLRQGIESAVNERQSEGN